MGNLEEGLYQAWLGEVRGEAFFMGMANHSRSAEEQHKWMRLAALEQFVGNALFEHLAEQPTEDKINEYKRGGAERVESYAAIPWQTAMEGFLDIIVQALEYYEKFRALATEETTDVIELLIHHEAALKEFVELEVQGESGKSLEPINAVFERWQS